MDLTTPSGVREWVQSTLQFEAGTVVRLSGGLVNFVWRVETNDGSIVVKHAREGLAINPEVRLSTDRLRFESEALTQFRPPETGLGAHFSLPQMLHYDSLNDVLAMEDMSKNFGPPVNFHGEVVGEFIGHLHQSTRDVDELAVAFDNHDVQRVRLETQYRQVRGWLSDAGVGNAERCGSIAETFGESLLERGDCIVMGDLWPAAFMGAPNSYLCTLIDWEFVHFGRPAQDIGHLAAHLLMHWRGVGSPFVLGPTPWSGEAMWSGFQRGYQRLCDEWDGELERELAVHAGCEILARTIGPLAASYTVWSVGDVERLVRYATRLITGDVVFGHELDTVFEF